MGPGASIIGINPPRHRKMRELVSRAFTPKAVQNLQTRIRTIVDQLIDAHRGDDAAWDIVADLTYPLPVIVIAEMLGIPPEDRDAFKRWSDAIVASTDNHGTGFEATRSMNAYFTEVIAQRRHDLGDDLISRLVKAEVDGERLTNAEIVSFCDLLLVAGNETTTNLITNAVWTFSEHPESWEALCATPDSIPTAIEEVLRYRSPVQAMFRSVRTATAIRGQEMAPHETVIAWIGSANHDDAKFTRPEEFEPLREPNPHIAFGYGIHYCLGAPLARLESRIALEAFVDRGIRRFELGKSAARLEPVGGFIVHGVKELPISIVT